MKNRTQNHNTDYKSEEYSNMSNRQKIIVRRLDRTRDRIITWAGTHGWSNIKNYAETRNDNDNIVWFQTDYEFIDSWYKSMFNRPRLFGRWEMKTLSKIWSRYPKRESNRFYNNYRRTANGWTVMEHDDFLDGTNHTNEEHLQDFHRRAREWYVNNVE